MTPPTPLLVTRHGRASFWACALLATLLLTPVVWAQGAGDDPSVDPKSPAGTEYELPIERAREDARGAAESTSSGGTGVPQSPLFGEGVGPDRQSGSSAASAGTRSSDVGSPDGTGGHVGASEPELSKLRAQASPPASAGGTLIAIGAGAAGLLLVGGLVGLLWRRRSTRG